MLQLIPEWKDVWKFYSTWAVFALTAWNMLPVALAGLIPMWLQITVSVVLFASAIAVRVVDQPSVTKGKTDDEKQ